MIRPELGFSVRLLSERRKKSKAKRCTVIHTVSYEISMEKNNEIHIISNLPCIEHTTEKRTWKTLRILPSEKSRQKKNFEKITQTAMWFGLFTVHIRLGGQTLSRLPCRFAFRLLIRQISGLVSPRSADRQSSARGSYHRESLSRDG